MIAKSQLGKDGPAIGRIGYGAMVLEGLYGESDDSTSINTLCHAMEQGMMIDTADAYGNGHNEGLVSRAIQRSSTTAFIATKFGIVFGDTEPVAQVPTGWGFSLNLNSSASYAKKALEASLQRLDLDCIDLWYAHYLDSKTPVEETVQAMADAVKQGKVRHLGLSNVTAQEIRRAHAIHPIAAVQYEYSLWRREPETELLPTLRELGIALVGWAPLGSGMLTGTVDKLEQNDFRHNNPRYAGDNLSTNRDRFAPFMQIAQELNITPAQLALAWCLHRGDDIFPIPGTRRISRIDENNQALNVRLSEDIMGRIDEIAPPGLALGDTLL